MQQLTPRRPLVAAAGLKSDELRVIDDFQAWFQSPGGELLRVHLLQFTTPDAPRPIIDALGGRFMARSQLRGGSMTELLSLRRAFGLFGHDSFQATTNPIFTGGQ